MPIKSLREAFNTDLTNSQEKAVEMLSGFLESETPCFILKGYAGTGKTFILNGIADYLNSLSISFGIMAPTGRAAQIVTKKSGFFAQTIHRGIYAMDKTKEYKRVSENGSISSGIYTEIKDSRTMAAVYLIDEASMISDNYSEFDYFRYGSGYLLKDLIEFSKLDYNKIIFIGDSAQLPPVNSEESPALSKKYLKKHYKVKSIDFELTDVVRQEEESGILENATEIRNSIRREDFSNLNISLNFSDMKAVKKPDILREYIRSCEDSINSKNIIIAHSNLAVQYYNELIRQHFFPDDPEISEGDRIILVQNNYNYEIDLMNGEMGEVLWAEPSTEDRKVPVYIEDEQFDVPLSFRNVRLGFRDVNGYLHEIECKIIDNLLKSGERDITLAESRALFIDFKRRHPYLKPSSEDYQIYLRSDPYLNCLKVKYGYAVTCHKAQGGEWENVFIDFSNSRGYNNQNYFRWAYTALTRSSKTVFAVKAPVNRIYHSIDYSANKSYNSFAVYEDVIAVNTGSEYAQSKLIQGLDDFLRNIFIVTDEIISEQDYSIKEIRHFPFCERYFIESTESKYQLNIWYTKNNKVSAVNIIDEMSGDAGQSNQLKLSLNILSNKQIIPDTELPGA